MKFQGQVKLPEVPAESTDPWGACDNAHLFSKQRHVSIIIPWTILGLLIILECDPSNIRFPIVLEKKFSSHEYLYRLNKCPPAPLFYGHIMGQNQSTTSHRCRRLSEREPYDRSVKRRICCELNVSWFLVHTYQVGKSRFNCENHQRKDFVGKHSSEAMGDPGLPRWTMGWLPELAGSAKRPYSYANNTPDISTPANSFCKGDARDRGPPAAKRKLVDY